MERRVIFGLLGAVLAVCVVGIVRERKKLMGGTMPHYSGGEVMSEREDGAIRVYPDYESGKVVFEVGPPNEEPDFVLHIPPDMAYDTARSLSICCMKIEDHRGEE